MDVREVKDLAGLQDWQAVTEASFAHDFTDLPADPIEEILPLIEGHQPPGEIVAMFVGYDGATPVGSAKLVLWTLDNLNCAGAEIDIHPDHRRRGFGRQLTSHVIDGVRAVDRSRLFIDAAWNRDGSEGDAFPLLRSLGAKAALDDYRRTLDLAAFPVGAPSPAPAGYRVESWVDIAPDHVADGVAYLLHRMVLDAPMGELDIEPEKWDAERLRASEQSAMRRHRTRYTTVVVHEESGEVAGLTEIAVNLQRPQIAYQWNTIVDPLHRGNRLGMVLKSHNHKHLVDAIPELRLISTWNATSNSFMIDVNEALGFRIAEKWTEWQLDL